MDELIGDQHDVSYPVVGSARVVNVGWPEALGKNSELQLEMPASSSDNQQPKSPGLPAASNSRKQKRSGEVLEFLHQSEENSQWHHEDIMRRHEYTMEQLKSAQDDFKNL